MGFEPTTFSLGSNQSRFDKARNGLKTRYIIISILQVLRSFVPDFAPFRVDYPLTRCARRLPHVSNVKTASNVNVAGSGITDSVPLV